MKDKELSRSIHTGDDFDAIARLFRLFARSIGLYVVGDINVIEDDEGICHANVSFDALISNGAKLQSIDKGPDVVYRVINESGKYLYGDNVWVTDPANADVWNDYEEAQRHVRRLDARVVRFVTLRME